MGAGAVGPRRVDVGDELRRIDASMDHARRGSSEENALVAEVREGSVVRTGTGRLVTTSNSDAIGGVWRLEHHGHAREASPNGPRNNPGTRNVNLVASAQGKG